MMAAAASRRALGSDAAFLGRHRVAALVLVVVMVAGVALRADRAVDASGDRGRRVSTDEKAYGRIAVDLVRHGSYGDRAMGNPVYWAPGAPFAFAATEVVAPAQKGYRLPGVPVLQFGLGVGLIALAWALGRRLAGPAGGLVAAAIVAAYPPFVFLTGTQLSEPLAAVLVAAALLAAHAAWDTRRRAAWAAAGALLGLAILTRADLLMTPLVVAAVFGWFAWRRAGRREAATLALWLLAGAAVVTLPWIAWASVHQHRPVPVSDGGSNNVFVGTYLPGDGTLFGLKRELGPETRRLHPDLRRRSDYQLTQYEVLRTVAHRRPDEPFNRALRDEALANLSRYGLRHPADFAAMLAGKAKRMWLMYFVGGGRERQLPVSIAHLVLVLLALAGLVAGIAVARDPMLVAIAALVAYSTAVNVVLVAEPRHNLPLLPVLVAGGVAGAVRVIASARERGRSVSHHSALAPG
jgi:4-amino-4-deoxy-L-arabinose transferase-like glycosyltransferase